MITMGSLLHVSTSLLILLESLPIDEANIMPVGTHLKAQKFK